MNKAYTKVNSNLLTTLYITGFIISGAATGLCLCTMGQSKVSKILLLGMTCIFEFSKGISFFEAVSGRHQSKVTKIWFITWAVLTCFSLFASMAFSINETGKIKNDSFTKSSVYKTKIDEQSRLKKQITSKENQIANISKEKDSTILAMQKEMDALPKNLITRRQEALNNIKTYSDSQQAKIDQYNKELTELNTKLDTLADSTAKMDYKVTETNGYIAILTTIADFLNKSGLYISNKWKFNELELIFYFLLSLTLEIVICLLYYLKKFNQLNAISEKFSSSKDRTHLFHYNKENETEQLNKITEQTLLSDNKIRLINCNSNNRLEQPKQRHKFEAIKNSNKIGFKLENNSPVTLGNLAISDNDFDNFTEDELIEYLTYIYENKSGSVSPGQAKICEHTNLSYRQIKDIRNFLESKGILKVDDKTTYLTYNKLDDVFNLLSFSDGKYKNIRGIKNYDV